MLEITINETSGRVLNRPAWLPSIGPCVRKVKVALKTILAAEERYGRFRKAEATQFDHGCYLSQMAMALESGLPDLAVLHWSERNVVPSRILEAICCSPVKELTFSKMSVNESVDLAQRLTDRGMAAYFPLRSLDFDMTWDYLHPYKPP